MKKQSITLTQDGIWLHGKDKVTHKRTISLFFKSVIFKKGKYFLTGEKKPVPIVVEDVAFFVKGLKSSQDGFILKLSNATEELLNKSSLFQNEDNILYCTLKNKAPARFERKVYYELMQSLTKKQGYLGLVLDGLFYPLKKAKKEKSKPKPKKSAKKKTAKKKSS